MCGNDDHVRQLQDRLRRVGRLLLQHVEAGAGQPPLLQGSGEGGLIHHSAAGGVHQVCRGPHQAQLAGTDEMA